MRIAPLLALYLLSGFLPGVPLQRQNTKSGSLFEDLQVSDVILGLPERLNLRAGEVNHDKSRVKRSKQRWQRNTGPRSKRELQSKRPSVRRSA
jgi:hypothetical protein